MAEQVTVWLRHDTNNKSGYVHEGAFVFVEGDGPLLRVTVRNADMRTVGMEAYPLCNIEHVQWRIGTEAAING